MRVRRTLHYLAAVLGIALLVTLVLRTGTATVIHQVRTIGWGFVLILVVGGAGLLSIVNAPTFGLLSAEGHP
jgi:hypothetical protein